MNHLTDARRVVLKIGSALLVDDDGRLHESWLAGLAEDIVMLHDAGKEVIVVSSGAIALGRSALGLARGPLRLDEAQAAAAVGQIALAHAYRDALAAHHRTAAQILLTLGDTEERRRYLNARNTISTLLALSAIPIINENDTVATAEIRYGDNDRLAARVASMTSADCLILFSDVDGLYTSSPDRNPEARHIPEIRQITPEIEAMAGPSDRVHGTGGMITKLAAARIAAQAGCHMAIARGSHDRPVSALLDGARATWILAGMTPIDARKRWIAATLKPRGRLRIDAGAATALNTGKSLLPAGVVAVEGKFDRGDAVVIADGDDRELGRGLTAYSADDARRIIGRKTGEIEAILGYRGRTALVHRDDLVLTGR